MKFPNPNNVFFISAVILGLQKSKYRYINFFWGLLIRNLNIYLKKRNILLRQACANFWIIQYDRMDESSDNQDLLSIKILEGRLSNVESRYCYYSKLTDFFLDFIDKKSDAFKALCPFSHFSIPP